MKKYQIGVIGSSADKKLNKKLITIATNVGIEIAKSGNTLMFGAEKDRDSLSTQAAISAKKHGGATIAITYGGKDHIYNKHSADYVINTGSDRGGPRESVFVMSCDGVIAISGGSGTMTEMLIAYMNNIPIVVIKGTGGWSEKMANKFFDNRRRMRAVAVNDHKEAVKKIVKLINKNGI